MNRAERRAAAKKILRGVGRKSRRGLPEARKSLAKIMKMSDEPQRKDEDV